MDAVQVAEPTNKVAAWFARGGRFLAAVREELQRVTWPTRDELLKATRMIVVFSIVLGIVIGLMDKFLLFIFVELIGKLAAR